MKRKETQDEHDCKTVAYAVDDPFEFRMTMGFWPTSEPEGMRRNPGKRIRISSAEGVPDYKNLVVYGPGDWLSPEPENQ